MKYKTNISAILLATLVFVASNGIAVFEHICNTSNTRSFCVFTEPTCENEEVLSPCCEKMGLKPKEDCCSHTQIFSKLYFEGFIAKQMFLIPIEKQINANLFSINLFSFSQQIFENHYSGLSPPDNLFQIKSILQPSSIKLQIFRC
jgi:hypothetical protein